MAQREKKRRVDPEAVSAGKGEIVIYRGTKGAPALEVRLEGNTLWLTQKQIAMLFGTERSVITKHLRNVFRDGELERKSVCAKFAHTAEDGKVYQTDFYSLDAIISVGYRVNSVRGTQFRIWATGGAMKRASGQWLESAPMDLDSIDQIIHRCENLRTIRTQEEN